MNWELNNLLREALMCSIFASPTDPGLDYAELQEVGRRSGYREGEISDTIQHVPKEYYQNDRLVPPLSAFIVGINFMPEDPELHDFDALDFVIGALNERIKDEGVRSARLDKSVLVEQAVSAGIERMPVQAAILYLTFIGTISIKDDVISAPQAMGPMNLPGKTRRGWRGGPLSPNAARAKALPIVQDIISRRADGRLPQVDVLNAFPEALNRLGYSHFRLWWVQVVSEMRSSDPNVAPVSALILSAALVEGVLTFMAKYARDQGLAVFRSNDFNGDPKSWKLEELVKSAASGGEGAILSLHAKARVETLIKARQRIHAGRMLTEYPGGPPDLKPEQARDAKDTAELVVRSVLEWLERQQAAPGAS